MPPIFRSSFFIELKFYAKCLKILNFPIAWYASDQTRKQMQISRIISVKSRISNLPVIKEKITPPAIQRARSVSEIKTAMFIIFAVLLLFSLFLARVSSRVILFIKPSLSYSTPPKKRR